jgi:hypothetical protein
LDFELIADNSSCILRTENGLPHGASPLNFEYVRMESKENMGITANPHQRNLHHLPNPKDFSPDKSKSSAAGSRFLN